MHAIARIAIFRDERLVVNHPELAVQSRQNKSAWRENGKLVWTDPSNPKVQDYDIALAKYTATLGVDEIQFDYVRFPAEGDQKDAQFVYQKDQPEPAQSADASASADNGTCGDGRLARPATAKPSGPDTSADAKQETPKVAEAKSAAIVAKKGNKSRKDRATAACAAKPRGPQRTDVITAFLKKAYAELHPTGVLLSLDVFGVMAWQRQVDLAHTGQDIVGMAHYCDVLSPMIYPSHFFGMDNIEHPGDEPAHFIGESMDRFELITKGSGVTIRPWLQAFHWRTKTYRKTAAQVVIRWHLDSGLIVIPKTVRRERLRENFGALAFRLDDDDMRRIEALDSPAGRIGPDPASGRPSDPERRNGTPPALLLAACRAAVDRQYRTLTICQFVGSKVQATIGHLLCCPRALHWG